MDLSDLRERLETPHLNATREPPRAAFELKAGSAYDSQQIAAGAPGQQLGRLGSAYARRGLDVAPTLEVRPGYRCTVILTEDIVLPPWKG